MQLGKVESVRCIGVHVRGCTVESVLAKGVLGRWGCYRTPLICSVKTCTIVCYTLLRAIVHKYTVTMVYLERHTVQDM